MTMNSIKMNQEIVSRQLLKDKVALIYAATGDVGSTVAWAFALEGAQVFLSARRLPEVRNIAKEISSSGGIAEAAQVDSLDEGSVEKYVQEVFEKIGQIDISFNDCRRTRRIRNVPQHLQNLPMPPYLPLRISV